MSDVDRSVAEAVKLLRGGELVAIPTETVYGLAADATNPAAVAKIFALKGRPATNPLIVHVADVARAQRFTSDWNKRADKLAEAFWPGPLTLVVQRGTGIADAVTAGGATVGLRVPAHPTALSLLHAFDGGLAAPSANRSNHVSPTTAQHVRDEFGDAVTVLDGGPCDIGIESTVVDVSGEGWRILRLGMISAAAIALVLDAAAGAAGSSRSSPSSSSQKLTASAVASDVPSILKSPGQLAVHYAPRTPAFRFASQDRPNLDLTNAAIIELTLEPTTYARNLYARLRLLDSQHLDAIYVELPPDTPEWAAVRDRLMRATRPLP